MLTQRSRKGPLHWCVSQSSPRMRANPRPSLVSTNIVPLSAAWTDPREDPGTWFCSRRGAALTATAPEWRNYRYETTTLATPSSLGVCALSRGAHGWRFRPTPVGLGDLPHNPNSLPAAVSSVASTDSVVAGGTAWFIVERLMADAWPCRDGYGIARCLSTVSEIRPQVGSSSVIPSKGGTRVTVTSALRVRSLARRTCKAGSSRCAPACQVGQTGIDQYTATRRRCKSCSGSYSMVRSSNNSRPETRSS